MNAIAVIRDPDVRLALPMPPSLNNMFMATALQRKGRTLSEIAEELDCRRETIVQLSLRGGGA